MCILCSLECINDLEHSLQINGFSPEGVLRCIKKWKLLGAIVGLDYKPKVVTTDSSMNSNVSGLRCG